MSNLSQEQKLLLNRLGEFVNKRMEYNDRVAEHINNLFTRSSLTLSNNSDNPDPRRNMNRECGYPDNISLQMYQNMFDRSGLGARIVSMLPDECWKVPFQLYEDENPENETEFEDAYENLGSKLRGVTSFYESTQEGDVLCSILRRLDIQSGIGSFGIAILGYDDGENLTTPIEGFEDNVVPEGNYEDLISPITFPKEGAIPKKRNLIYIKIYPETQVTIEEVDNRPHSPRYGHPILYRVTLTDNEAQQPSIIASNTYVVHWSRVLHVPSDDSPMWDITGIPRLKNVFNYVLDYEKVRGGSAEMYWQGAMPGMQVSTHPNLGTEVDIDTATTQDELEKLFNGLQRYIILTGMEAKTLAPTVVSPAPQLEAQIQAICIAKQCPMNVLIKGRVGEPTQDGSDELWDERIKGRQTTHVIPRILVPLVDLLIHAGVLPPPESYGITWPNMHTKTDAEKASNAMQRTQALVTYSNSKASLVVSPMDYLVRFLWFTEDEAESIIANAEAFTKEMGIAKSFLLDDGQSQMGNQKDLKNGVQLPKGSGAKNDGKVILPTGDTTTGKNPSPKIGK